MCITEVPNNNEHTLREIYGVIQKFYGLLKRLLFFLYFIRIYVYTTGSNEPARKVYCLVFILVFDLIKFISLIETMPDVYYIGENIFVHPYQNENKNCFFQLNIIHSLKSV